MPEILSNHKLPYPFLTPSIINICLKVLEIMFTQGSETPYNTPYRKVSNKSYPETSLQLRLKKKKKKKIKLPFFQTRIEAWDWKSQFPKCSK